MDPPTELEDENPDGAELLEYDPPECVELLEADPTEYVELLEDDPNELESSLEPLENQDELFDDLRRVGCSRDEDDVRVGAAAEAEARPTRYPPAAANPIAVVLQPSPFCGRDAYDESLFADFRGFTWVGSSSSGKTSLAWVLGKDRSFSASL